MLNYLIVIIGFIILITPSLLNRLMLNYWNSPQTLNTKTSSLLLRCYDMLQIIKILYFNDPVHFIPLKKFHFVCLSVHKNSRIAEQIFIKLGIDIMPPENTTKSYFLIFYEQ
jgi:hypothetical protein